MRMRRAGCAPVLLADLIFESSTPDVELKVSRGASGERALCERRVRLMDTQYLPHTVPIDLITSNWKNVFGKCGGEKMRCANFRE